MQRVSKRTSEGLRQKDPFTFIELGAWRKAHPGEEPPATALQMVKGHGVIEGVWIRNMPEGHFRFDSFAESSADHTLELEDSSCLLTDDQVEMKLKAAKEAVSAEDALKKAVIATAPAIPTASATQAQTHSSGSSSDSDSSSSDTSGSDSDAAEKWTSALAPMTAKPKPAAKTKPSNSATNGSGSRQLPKAFALVKPMLSDFAPSCV